MKMVEMKKPWVQIAMDVTDVDLACEYAKMAVEIGADWIEVGTPLIYYEMCIRDRYWECFSITSASAHFL